MGINHAFRIGLIWICTSLYSCNVQRPEPLYQGSIMGESMALRGEEYTELLHTDILNIKLYLVQPNRDTVVLVNGIDYIITDNRVKRTPSSRIPDFGNHKVKLEPNGQFIWTSEPNRNPELTLPYHVYADYIYTAPYERVVHGRISKNLQSKILTQKEINLAYIGTSISFGVHTIEGYYHNNDSQTYVQMIAKSLRKIYNMDVNVSNFSTDGGGVNQIEDLEQIIATNPTLIILELGMNDHTGPLANVDYYYKSLENAIIKIQDKQIEIIVLGFFQQNPNWNLERVTNTIDFNNVLRTLTAKYKIDFVDIYSIFETIDKDKLYKDYMGDFIHHPTSFAHQFYYLGIMPFLLSRSMSEQTLLNYIY